MQQCLLFSLFFLPWACSVPHELAVLCIFNLSWRPLFRILSLRPQIPVRQHLCSLRAGHSGGSGFACSCLYRFRFTRRLASPMVKKNSRKTKRLEFFTGIQYDYGKSGADVGIYPQYKGNQKSATASASACAMYYTFGFLISGGTLWEYALPSGAAVPTTATPFHGDIVARARRLFPRTPAIPSHVAKWRGNHLFLPVPWRV